MKAEDVLDALPVNYYVIDLNTKTILQTNDPTVNVGKESCHQQLFMKSSPCSNGNKSCFCEEIVEANDSGSHVLESGSRKNKRFYKIDIKKIGESKVIASYDDITTERSAVKELKINNIMLDRAESLAGFGSWEIDLNDGVMIASPGAGSIYGVDKLRMPLEEVQKIPLPEYRKALDRELEGLISGRKQYNIAFRIKRPCDGEIRYVQSIGEYREDKKMVFGVIKDITEKVNYESALQDSVADLRLAQKIARIGNWKFNPVTRLLSVSDQVNQILENFKIPAHPDIGSFKNLTGRKQYHLFKKVVLQAIAAGKPFENQFKIEMPNGMEKWIEIICRPDSERSTQGHLLRGTIQDITGTKEVESELQHSNNLFRTLIQNLPDAIYMKDTDCRKIIANNGDARNCGMEKAKQVIGKTDYEIYPRKIADKYFEDDQQVIVKGIPVINREEVLPGNPKRWILTTKVPLRDKDGRITGLVGIGHDITHRKIMEEELKAAKLKAEESDRLKSVFLANMSHEIRTPLNGILGFSNLISSGIFDPNQLKSYSRFIEDCGHRLTAVIENIIDISLIQSNQLKLQNSRFNLIELLEELYCCYKPQKKEQLAKIDFRLTGFLPGKSIILYSDRNRIHQVLKNLLDNAFKFTREGYIEFGCVESDEGELNLFVKDTGIGIEKSKLELIFENFRQVEEGFTRRYEGAGLGLPIVSGIIRRLGGNIRVKSVPGQGSTFYVSIPESTEDEEEITTEELHEAGYQAELQKKLPEKLIVSFEDDPASMEYLKSVTGLLGCRLVNFDNPLKGIEYLRKHKADLIFMDVRLPEMSGFEATQIIKSEFPNLPVIIQTAYALNDDREKAFSAGCDDYLAKPVPLKDLRGRIRHFIGEEN